MNKVSKRTWHLVKDISQRAYFWPLIGLIALGLILDIQSTYLFVGKLGIEEEISPVLVFLFHRFALLELGVGTTVLLALTLSTILLLVIVPLSFLAIVWISRGKRRAFKIFFFVVYFSLLTHAAAAGWNYYRYFLL